MTYETLMLINLGILADIALDESISIGTRLSVIEALDARHDEIEAQWPGIGNDERAKILAAMNLNLYHMGHI